MKKDQEGKVYRKESGNVSACLAAKQSLLMTPRGIMSPTLSLNTVDVWEEVVGSAESLIENKVNTWCERGKEEWEESSKLMFLVALLFV